MAAADSKLVEILKRFILISKDIENTGHTIDDIIFAIGIAYGYPGCEKIFKVQLIIFLREPGTLEEWRQFWIDSGFEMRCFNEFWSKNIDVLNTLMEKANIFPQEERSRLAGTFSPSRGFKLETAELAFQYNKALQEIEEKAHQSVLVFDTVTFDSAWLNYLLISHGYPSLSFTRALKYRWAYEIDSFIAGLLWFNFITGNWGAFDRLKKKVMLMLPHLGETKNSHSPDEDAENIVATCLRALAYCDYLAAKKAAFKLARQEAKQQQLVLKSPLQDD